jgi:hypothetical protein
MLPKNGRQDPSTRAGSPLPAALAWPRAEAPEAPPPADAGDEELDLEALAEEVVRLLLREAYVERERRGRP